MTTLLSLYKRCLQDTYVQSNRLLKYTQVWLLAFGVRAHSSTLYNQIAGMLLHQGKYLPVKLMSFTQIHFSLFSCHQ